MKRKPKLVLDTNIFISALLGSQTTSQILDLWVNGEIDLAFSDEIISEIREVLDRPKFRNRIDPVSAAKLISLLSIIGIGVNPTRRLQACRDPKDDFLLECAVEGNADYIITGDQDLLCLNHFEGIQILEPSEFLARWPKIRVSLHS